MKLYSKQKCDWNSYAFFAEEVEERYWGFFHSNLWWQLGNGFIKVYDNVPDCGFAADNFNRHGETAVKQQLRVIPAPWGKALDSFTAEMSKIGVAWYLHGSAALALHGIDVTPKDVNVIIPNASDYDKVGTHFRKLAIEPFQRCENWIMSGLGTIFLDAAVGIAFHNKELEPYDMSRLAQITRHGERIYLSTPEMLRQDNLRFGRIGTVKKIEAKMNWNPHITSRCGLRCDICTFKAPCNCGGCIATNGHPFHGECPVAKCCQDKGFLHCGECPDLPCKQLYAWSFEDKEHGDNGKRIEQCRQWALRSILSWFAQACWPLIATASRDYLDGKIDKAALLEAMKEADQQCGSCGCEFDALYKKVITIIS